MMSHSYSSRVIFQGGSCLLCQSGDIIMVGDTDSGAKRTGVFTATIITFEYSITIPTRVFVFCTQANAKKKEKEKKESSLSAMRPRLLFTLFKMCERSQKYGYTP